MNSRPDAKTMAERDMRHIAQLKDNPAFTEYFLRGPKREIARLERDLTTKRLNPVDAAEMIGELKALRGIVSKLENDEASNRNILGLSDGEKPL